MSPVAARPLADRFWAKVDKRGPAECWPWTGSLVWGYGSIGRGPRGTGTAIASRVSYEIHSGPVPDGLCVLHRCDNRACVNPAHLFLGDRAVNNRDMHEKGRNRQPKGEAVWCAKLTMAKVREAKKLRAAGVSGPRIARLLGVGTTAIYRAINGKGWGTA